MNTYDSTYDMHHHTYDFDHSTHNMDDSSTTGPPKPTHKQNADAVYVTQTVTGYITFCPTPTSWVQGKKTYSATASQWVTITACPNLCTISNAVGKPHTIVPIERPWTPKSNSTAMVSSNVTSAPITTTVTLACPTGTVACPYVTNNAGVVSYCPPGSVAVYTSTSMPTSVVVAASTPAAAKPMATPVMTSRNATGRPTVAPTGPILSNGADVVDYSSYVMSVFLAAMLLW
jgi:hypothetical protein